MTIFINQTVSVPMEKVIVQKCCNITCAAGWYYSFTGSGVTFATATPFAE